MGHCFAGAGEQVDLRAAIVVQGVMRANVGDQRALEGTRTRPGAGRVTQRILRRQSHRVATHYSRAVRGVSLLCLLLITAGCRHAQEDAADAGAAAIAVEAGHPQQGLLSEHIDVDAVLSPIAQAAISPKISAPVRRFYVQRGSHVKQGQLLAVLENSDLSAAALDSRGTYTAAQASYEAATKAQVPEESQRAELDLAQAKANLALNQSIVKNRKELFDQGALPGRDLDTAVAGLAQAQAAYDGASKHLQLQQAVGRSASLQAAKGQLTSAEGKYLGAHAQVGYSEIHAPISGVITDRPLFAGETAAAGAPLLTVMDTSSLLAKVHLAQSLAQRLTLGGQSMVAVPGIESPLPASVSLISPALDPGSTTVEVWLKLDNRRGALKVGTPVHVSITGRTVDHALLVPEAAVVASNQAGAYVLAVGADGMAHKHAVTTGIRDHGMVQVTGGITPQDTVVMAGAFTLEDGVKVKVSKPGEAADAP